MSEAPEEILLQGRLHWSSIFLGFALGFRHLAVMIVAFGLQAGTADDMFGLVMGVGGLSFVGVVLTVFPVIGWLRFDYVLTARELRIRSGLLRRRDRHIPVGHIQDLTTEVGPLHRLFGVEKVTVQTSSTESAEATLDGLSRADAAALSDALRSITRTSGAASDGPPTAIPPLVRSSIQQLLLRGLSDNRAGVVLASGLGIIDEYAGEDIRPYRAAFDVARDWLSPLIGAGSVAIASSIAVIVLGFMLAGYVASMAINVLLFGGFRLTERAGVFHRSYGLITKRTHAMPRRRIQAVRIEQTFLRRVLGLAEMKTDDMGAGSHEKSAERSGLHVFVPIAKIADLWGLAVRVLPGLDPSALDWRPISRRVVRRWAVRGALVGVVAAAALLWPVGPVALGALSVAIPAAVWGLLVHRSVRWSADERFFVARWGVLRRHVAFVPIERVQGVTVHSTPLDRLNGVATLSVIVGGGATIRLRHVALGDARHVAAELTRFETRRVAGPRAR